MSAPVPFEHPMLELIISSPCTCEKKWREPVNVPDKAVVVVPVVEAVGLAGGDRANAPRKSFFVADSFMFSIEVIGVKCSAWTSTLR